MHESRPGHTLTLRCIASYETRPSPQNENNPSGEQIVAGERVGPGPWMYHCHVQGHSDLGMSGIFLSQRGRRFRFS
ncbi:MAG: multicopper oxidase domain-containing protein [Actinobacteria bacterium]|nr:multicopper oxidase domain-containing protein [Actinomycetota bacterium]